MTPAPHPDHHHLDRHHVDQLHPHSDQSADHRHRYSRADTIADGLLIEVPTRLSRQFGIRWPLAMSTLAWFDAVAWDAATEAGQAPPHRADRERPHRRGPVGRAPGDHRNPTNTRPVTFTAWRVPPTGRETRAVRCTLTLTVHTGDCGETVATIHHPTVPDAGPFVMPRYCGPGQHFRATGYDTDPDGMRMARRHPRHPRRGPHRSRPPHRHHPHPRRRRRRPRPATPRPARHPATRPPRPLPPAAPRLDLPADVDPTDRAGAAPLHRARPPSTTTNPRHQPTPSQNGPPAMTAVLNHPDTTTDPGVEQVDNPAAATDTQPHDRAATETLTVIELRPEQVAQHPDNLRDAGRGITELARSVAEVGILVPLIVVPVDLVPGHDFDAAVTHVNRL